jgi:hypothetical protein
MKVNIKILLALITLNHVGKAQPYLDLISLSYNYQQSNNDDKNNQYHIWQGNLMLNVPLKIKHDVLLLTGGYDHQKINFDSSLLLENVHVALAWQHQWRNSRFKTISTFIPRKIAELDAWEYSNTYQYGGALLQTYQLNDHLNIKAGVYYNSEFFGDFWLPLAGVDWRINHRWRFWGVLPSSINAEFKMLPDRWHLVASLKTFTNSYRMVQQHYFRINDNQIQIALDYYPTKHLLFNFTIGHSLYRGYFYGYSGTRFIPYSSKLNINDAWVVKTGMAYRLRLDS